MINKLIDSKLKTFRNTIVPSRCMLYRGDLITFPESNRAYPFNQIFSNCSDLHQVNYAIKIERDMTIKVSYTVRVDWDAPKDRCYYFSIGINSGIQWGSHSAVYKQYMNQCVVSVANLFYSVKKGDYIELICNSNAACDANCTAFLTVEEFINYID